MTNTTILFYFLFDFSSKFLNLSLSVTFTIVQERELHFGIEEVHENEDAGGSDDMSELSMEVREITDAFDAAGYATAAIGTQLHSWQMVAQGKSGPAARNSPS